MECAKLTLILKTYYLQNKSSITLEGPLCAYVLVFWWCHIDWSRKQENWIRARSVMQAHRYSYSKKYLLICWPKPPPAEHSTSCWAGAEWARVQRPLSRGTRSRRMLLVPLSKLTVEELTIQHNTTSNLISDNCIVYWCTCDNGMDTSWYVNGTRLLW